MRNLLRLKILLSVLALSSITAVVTVPASAVAGEILDLSTEAKYNEFVKSGKAGWFNGSKIWTTGSKTDNKIIIGAAGTDRLLLSSSHTNIVAGQGYGEVSGNSIKMNNVQSGADVYGSEAQPGGAVIGNSVKIFNTMIKTVQSPPSVYGGRVKKGFADSNEIVIQNSEIDGSVYGADSGSYWSSSSKNLDVINNSVMVKDSIIRRDICGGSNGGGGSVINNFVFISGSSSQVPLRYDYSCKIYGGYTTAKDSKDALRNGVIIEDGDINAEIYGGYSAAGDTKDNFVNIQGGKISKTIYGGQSSNGIVDSNTVIINGGVVDGLVYGGYSNGTSTVKNNKIVISGGIVNESIYGGIVNESIYGGINYNLKNIGEDIANSIVVSDNIIDISGGKINDNVIAGYSSVKGGAIENNIIRLSGTADVVSAKLWGYSKTDEAKAQNNKLIVDSWRGDVARIANFNNIEIYNAVFNDEKGIINITNGRENDLENSLISVNSVVGGQEFAVGDELKIISSNIETGLKAANVDINGEINSGVAVVIEGTADESGNGIVLHVTKVKAQKQTYVASESRAAAAAFANQGSDLIADSLDTISNDGKYGIKTFAAVYGNDSKYDTCSHVNVNGAGVV